MNDIKNSIRNIGSTVNKIGRIALSAFGISKLAALGKQSIELASDIEEVQNVVDTAFGNMSYKIEDFSETCIEKFGLSELSAKEMSSTMMAMGSAMGQAADIGSDMAVELTGRLGDVASFYNKTIEEVGTLGKAVYSGETESLKQIGVLMTQENLQQFALQKGYKKTYQAMTSQEKLLVRQKYFLEATKLAAGDFEKTQDSWANQTKILTERWKVFLSVIGSSAITILTPLVKKLNSIVSAMTEAARKLGEIIEKVFGIKLQKAVNKGTNSMNQYTEAIQDSNDALAEQEKFLSSIDEINNLGSSKDNKLTTVDSGGLEVVAADDIGTSATEIGNTYINNIADAIRNGDWGVIASGISDLISNGIKKINKYLKKVDWSNLGKQIGSFISGIKWGDITINLMDLAIAIIQGLTEAFLGFAEEAPLAALALAIMGTLKLLKFSPKAAPITNMAGKFASTVMAAIGAAVGGFAAGRGFWAKYIAEDGDEWITQMGLMDTINYLLEDTDSLKEGFSMLWDDMVEGFSLSWNSFTTWLSETWVGEAVWSISNALSDFWDNVKGFFDGEDEIKNTFEDSIRRAIVKAANDSSYWAEIQQSSLWTYMKMIIEKSAGTSLEGIDLSDDLTEGIRNSIYDGFITGDWSKVAAAVADYNNQLAGQFGGNFNTDKHKKIIGAYIANTVADAIGTVNVGSKYVSSTLGNLVSTKLTPTSKFPTMPALASGAVIPPNKEFMAILGDQKQGVNIEAPLDTIVEAFNRAKGGGGNTTVIAQVNGRTLFEIFIDEYGKVVDETGKDPILGI